ncbi:MAG: hypothetical protein ACE5OZ_18870 [Candidatus Heimdallarchaeota archaeon]
MNVIKRDPESIELQILDILRGSANTEGLIVLCLENSLPDSIIDPRDYISRAVRRLEEEGFVERKLSDLTGKDLICITLAGRAFHKIMFC